MLEAFTAPSNSRLNLPVSVEGIINLLIVSFGAGSGGGIFVLIKVQVVTSPATTKIEDGVPLSHVGVCASQSL